MSLRVGAKVRLTIVRVTVTAAVLLFSVMDYALSVGFGLARAVRQHYRTFGASLAPGGATLLAAAPPPKPSVVVIGGSFAGLRVQRELSDNFDVTVVDLKEYFEYTPGVLRLYTQPEHLTALTAPLPQARNKLLVGEATAVTTSPRVVRLRLADADATELDLPYDYLLVASGVSYPCAPIKPSAAERTLAARQARWDGAAAALQEAASVIVVGGGLVGVELAAEIVEAYPSKPLTLITSGAALCSTLPPRVGRAARAWLEARGVAIRSHAPVDAVDAVQGTVQLQGGETLAAGVVYDCRGNGPAHSADLTGKGSALASVSDAHGQLAVDSQLRLAVDSQLPPRQEEGATSPQPIRIFAAGDVMRLAGCHDLKVGHTAELNADVVAANIRRTAAGATTTACADSTADATKDGTTSGAISGIISGKISASSPQLEEYPHGAVGAHVAPRVFCVSLGEGYGVLSFNGIVIEGGIAAVVKALLEWTKVAACAERPVGVLFWKLGDAAANWISRNLVSPPDAPPPRAAVATATRATLATGK